MHATIAFNRPLSPAYRHLGLATPGFSPAFDPGQFLMARPLGSDAPFLPRAFSIYRLTGEPTPVLEILYKIVGKGTQCLSGLAPGAEVDVLGPLGNRFTLPRPNASSILVAGGIGVPPIAALARRLGPGRDRGLHVFLGGRTSEDILCVKDFEEVGATVHVATEDGSLGARALVTELLEPFLLKPCRVPGAEGRKASHEPRAASRDERVLYTCGPPGMLRAVALLAARYGVWCETSVEATMACGFGACMGCAVAVKTEDSQPRYKLVCKDGPVFDSRLIDWTRA